jgi:uncharacterized protein YecA (UPF0149 family)
MTTKIERTQSVSHSENHAEHVHGPHCHHDHAPILSPYVRQDAKVGRNDPCPCGSLKKYKKCCG